MKSTEILQALKLVRSKSTMDYCGKLVNLFIFLSSNKQDILEAVITDTDLTVNEHGKSLHYEQVRKEYLQHKVCDYRYNNKEITELTKQENEYNSELRHVNEILWKKRKNKNNSVLESEKTEIEANIKETEESKEALIKAESERLQTLTFDISKMRKDLHLFTGCKITVKTGINKGEFSFMLPVDNSFYYAVCDMLNIKYEVMGAIKETVKIINSIPVEAEIFKTLSKAVKFVSADDLRPVMQHVCIALENGSVEIIATDAHRMYMSNKKEAGQKERIEILISVKDAIEISKMTFYSGEVVELNILDNGKIMIEDKIFDTFTDRKYVDYKCVIPEYKNKMTFHRKDMISSVKSVQVYANKSTNQVNLYLNGCIELSAQDVDFSFDSTTRMNYVSKSFKDTAIAFNGTFLRDTLSIFKTENVDMLCEGNNKQAAIFTDGTDRVLLMPLMMND